MYELQFIAITRGCDYWPAVSFQRSAIRNLYIRLFSRTSHSLHPNHERSHEIPSKYRLWIQYYT